MGRGSRIEIPIPDTSLLDSDFRENDPGPWAHL